MASVQHSRIPTIFEIPADQVEIDPAVRIDPRLARTYAGLNRGEIKAALTRMVYAKPPFAGPQAVLAYLSRYTHRVAISNRRLVGFHEDGVTFRFKDYRRDGAERQQVMTLTTNEFIRRF